MKFLCVVLVLCLTEVSFGFLTSSGTCKNRCGHRLDRDKSCQCNSHCYKHNDCCGDYDTLCRKTGSTGSCGSITSLSESLWRQDVNRLTSSDLTVNLQTKVTDGSSVDRSSKKLFTKVNEKYFQTRKTFSTFIKLLDNYVPTKGVTEKETPTETTEINNFLDAVLNTQVMMSLQKYLTCRGIVDSSSDFKRKLKKIWFEPYSRSGSSLDSSGFEHVMVGEWKPHNKVNGFHNWVSFYLKEKQGNLNYYGYVKDNRLIRLVGAEFSWKSHLKTLGSFLIGSSPEFDMALYTLCFLTSPNQPCYVQLDGQKLVVKTFSLTGHVATAYISL